MNRYRTVNQLERQDAACIAGLADGEGTVTLTTMHRGENRRLVVRTFIGVCAGSSGSRSDHGQMDIQQPQPGVESPVNCVEGL
jgi:hypothetical protein